MKNRIGKEIIFNSRGDLSNKAKLLEQLTLDNPTKDYASKIRSLLASETYSTMFIEGEISSRRSIKRTFASNGSKKIIPGTEALVIDDFINAYNYAIKPREFSISNLYTLYSLVSSNGLDKEDKLDDGEMYRSEDVFISSNSLNGEYKGFDPSDIKPALYDLFDMMNNQDINIFIRAVVGHVYFEMIHPFYDFNGRTGRFLPLWLFSNEGRVENMLYFATAVANYRKQYISLFRKYIDSRTYEVNMDKLAGGIMDLLILNQRQYIWIKNLEQGYIDITSKSFSDLQKSFIWSLMIKSQISNGENSWFKLTKEDKDFIEVDLKPAYFSQEIKKLDEAGIIKRSSDKIKRYKLPSYKLF